MIESLVLSQAGPNGNIKQEFCFRFEDFFTAKLSLLRLIRGIAISDVRYIGQVFLQNSTKGSLSQN